MSTLKLSKSAREWMDTPGAMSNSVNSYAPVGGNESDLISAAEFALQAPANSGWHDDRLWNTHTLMFAHAPASGDILGESNLRSILKNLTGLFPGDERVSEGGFGSWTYAHFDAVLLRVLDKRGRITPEFCEAYDIAMALRDYPVFDESDLSELENEYWEKSFDEEFDWLSRGVEVSDADRTRISEYVGEKYYGYGEPGYVDPDWIREAGRELGIMIEEED